MPARARRGLKSKILIQRDGDEFIATHEDYPSMSYLSLSRAVSRRGIEALVELYKVDEKAEELYAKAERDE
jgi:hypothetical protein